jgi:hypothetical protein
MDDQDTHHVNTTRGTGNPGTRYQSQLLRTPQHRPTDHDVPQYQSASHRTNSRFSIDSNINPRIASNERDPGTSHQTSTIIPSTLLETQAPTLTASTKVAYDAFIIAYEAYIMKGGVQLFKDRISPQAKNGYRNRIPNIDTISNDEFQILMKSIHYVKGTLKSTLQFPTMTRSETYVRELCDTYHDSFSNKYFSDTMQTSNLTDEAVAKAFITGIGYATS